MFAALQQYKNDSYLASKQTSGQSASVSANTYPSYYTSDTSSFTYKSNSGGKNDNYQSIASSSYSTSSNATQSASYNTSGNFSQSANSYSQGYNNSSYGGGYERPPQKPAPGLPRPFTFPAKPTMPEKDKTKDKVCIAYIYLHNKFIPM